jgi:hypothetical protein
MIALSLGAPLGQHGSPTLQKQTAKSRRSSLKLARLAAPNLGQEL